MSIFDRTMFVFERTDVQRIAVSAVGALLLSAACVGAAVSPVHAATPNAPATIDDWQAVVEKQIDAKLRMPEGAFLTRDVLKSQVAVRVGSDGDVAGIDLAHSSGSRTLDREALRVARAIAYPALPEGLRDRPQTITMNVRFASSKLALLRDDAEQRLAANRTAGQTRTAALPRR